MLPIKSGGCWTAWKATLARMGNHMTDKIDWAAPLETTLRRYFTLSQESADADPT